MPRLPLPLLTALALLANAVLFTIQAAAAPNKPAFSNKTVRSITVHVRDIFGGGQLNRLYRTAHQLKASTCEDVVRNELFFTEGDVIDEFYIKESERNLRAQRYLRNAKVTYLLEGDFVDVDVSVQDTWTIIPQISYSSSGGDEKRSIGLEESNLAGQAKRLGLLYHEEDRRESVEAVWHDRHLMNSRRTQLLAAYFDRNDGERAAFSLGQPFRGLIDSRGWDFRANYGDTIGRLFEDGDEHFIYRQEKFDLNALYIFSHGHPEVQRRRYAAGWAVEDADFSEADEDDFEALDLDPDDLDQDPSQLAEPRRFSGPQFTIETIVPDYLSMAYIDRFDRVQDYNLGWRNFLALQAAPEAAGSDENALLFSGNTSKGWAFHRGAFLRGETGLASRATSDDIQNTLLRGELKYYDVLGSELPSGTFIGKHTFAVNFFVDYGEDLDRDREFLVGGDNALRGYDARAFSGDKRLVLNIEDRVHLVDDLFRFVSLGTVVFADFGGAAGGSFGHLLGSEIYSDVGAGLRIAFPRVSGSRVLRLDVAFPLRDGPDGSEQWEPRVLLSGGQLFSSFLRSEIVGPETATVGVGFD